MPCELVKVKNEFVMSCVDENRHSPKPAPTVLRELCTECLTRALKVLIRQHIQLERVERCQDGYHYTTTPQHTLAQSQPRIQKHLHSPSSVPQPLHAFLTSSTSL